MTLSTIGVLMVSDYIRVHQGISAAIEAFDDLELVGHANNGIEAIQLCEDLQPDVVIMDVLMSAMNGIEATQIIRRLYAKIKVLALSSFQDDRTIRDMLQAGANGFLFKNSSIDD